MPNEHVVFVAFTITNEETGAEWKSDSEAHHVSQIGAADVGITINGVRHRVQVSFVPEVVPLAIVEEREPIEDAVRRFLDVWDEFEGPPLSAEKTFQAVGEAVEGLRDVFDATGAADRSADPPVPGPQTDREEHDEKP